MAGPARGHHRRLPRGQRRRHQELVGQVLVDHALSAVEGEQGLGGLGADPLGRLAAAAEGGESGGGAAVARGEEERRARAGGLHVQDVDLTIQPLGRQPQRRSSRPAEMPIASSAGSQTVVR